MNKPAYIMLDNSITVFVDGKPTTINSSHPNFSKVKDAIFNAQYDKIVGLLSIEDAISNMSSGKIKVSDGRIFYGNTQIHGVVVNKLLEMLKAGAKDVQPLVSFIERLMANPSANSVDQLYTFLSYKSLPITSTGKFLAYKGVKNDFYSKNGNSNTVVVCGKVNQAGEIYNGVGETIEVARNSVDDNKENHCSFGLHVGSYDYANDWAGNNGRLLVVEVDPADAVSVPTDCSFQKLRVSKYKVLHDITPERKEIPLSFYNESDNLDDLPDYEDDVDYAYDAPENSSKIVNLKIRNYIENKHKQGVNPTVKQIQSALKNYKLSAQEILNIAVNELGYLDSRTHISSHTSNVIILPAF